MLAISAVDLGELAMALQDQNGGYGEHRWLIDPATGELTFWTEDAASDGLAPRDLDDTDLVAIFPLPSHVWYEDMVDFVDGISDQRAARSLARAIEGRGAFRRFKDRLHEGWPDLLPVWYAFRDGRAERRAVRWLLDEGLVEADDAERYLIDHPDPALSDGAATPGQALLGTAVQLGASADALAALAAYVRLQTEGLEADPAVHELLAKIASELLGAAPGADAADGAAPVVGLARAFLRQAAELVDNPGRSGGWDQVDVPLLQSIGRLSMSVVDAVLAAERLLPDLAGRLAAPEARFLDVGTGVGWLAIAFARAHPGVAVVGIDLFEPALELARRNVAAEGLSDRIELRLLDAADLDEPGRYDVVWLPLPFLPAVVVPAVLGASVRSLRPGGWLLAGTFTGTGDRLSQLLTDLRIVRSGGHPWRPEEIIATLAGAGLGEAQEVPRAWAAPVRLFAASAAGRGVAPLRAVR